MHRRGCGFKIFLVFSRLLAAAESALVITTLATQTALQFPSEV
jgi:hypothetical protein